MDKTIRKKINDAVLGWEPKKEKRRSCPNHRKSRRDRKRAKEAALQSPSPNQTSATSRRCTASINRGRHTLASPSPTPRQRTTQHK